jgi:hypothetical protein
LRRNPLARSRCRRALCEPSTDPDDYGAAIRGTTIDLTVTERGAFDAKLVRIDLYRLWMQRFSENLARVVDAANLLSGRAYIVPDARVATGTGVSFFGISAESE